MDRGAWWATVHGANTSASLTAWKPLMLWIIINRGKFWKTCECQNTWPASWETCMRVKKQQLELDMEQQTVWKLGREHMTRLWVSLVAQMVKKLPVMREPWVRSLGWEDPLEEGMSTHSGMYSHLENPHGQRSLTGYSPWGHKELDTTKWLNAHMARYIVTLFI